ncbi:MAG: mechanosensitive ion channel family protein, partial [Mucilaginibacter polytrichastri]|nr:mechanosensitive ion channel family protein [Mucilaginibacter polytrichastri]
DNRQVIVPNGKLSNEVILNVTHLGTRRLEIKLSLSYYADIDAAREVIADVIKKNENILADPPPRIGILNLEEGVMVMTIRVWVSKDVYLGTRLSLNEEIVKAIRKAGIVQPPDQDLFVVMKDKVEATPPMEEKA